LPKRADTRADLGRLSAPSSEAASTGSAPPSSRWSSKLPSPRPATLADAFHVAFWWSAGFSAVAVLLAPRLPGPVEVW